MLKHFRPFKHHPLIKESDVTRNYTYYFRDNSICYEFKANKIVHRGPYPPMRNRDLFGKHLALLEDFTQKSKFREFYQENVPFYRAQVEKFRKNMPVWAMWEWLEERFPGSFPGFPGVRSFV